MRIKDILRLVLGGVVIAAIFVLADIQSVLSRVFAFDLWFAIPVFALLFAVLLATTVNLKILLDRVEKVSFAGLFEVLSYSWILGYTGLGRMGDLAIIPGLAKKSAVGIGKASAIFLLNKAISFFAISIVAVIGVVFFFPQYTAQIGIAGTVLCALFAFAFSGQARAILKKIIPEKYLSKFANFSSTLNEFQRKHTATLAKNFAMCIVILGLQSLVYYLIILGLGGKPEFIWVFFLLTATSLLTAIPISLASIGPREAAFVLMAGAIGISQDVAAATIAIAAAFDTVVVFVLASYVSMFAKFRK